MSKLMLVFGDKHKFLKIMIRLKTLWNDVMHLNILSSLKLLSKFLAAMPKTLLVVYRSYTAFYCNVSHPIIIDAGNTFFLDMPTRNKTIYCSNHA